MKLSNELKVALLALSAIALLIWGFSFLRGQKLFSSGKIVYAVYDNVDGLTKSSTVNISGLKVGLVTKIQLMDDFSSRVVVTMELEEDVKVPRHTTIAQLEDLSVLGGKAVNLTFIGRCDGDNCLQAGDTLVGASIGLVDNLTKEFDPYIERAQGVYHMIDSMFKEFSSGKKGNSLGLNKTLSDFQAVLANLKNTTYSLNGMIKNSSSDVETTLASLSAIAANLKNREAEINQVIGNVGKFSDRLEGIQLEETVDSTQMTFAKVNETLRTLDGAIVNIQTLINSINNGDGTLSKLIKDDELYKEVNEAINSVHLLTDDIRLNPKRYINLRRKNKPYEKLPDPEDNNEK